MAAAQLHHDGQLLERVQTDWIHTDVSAKLTSRLHVAGHVRQGGQAWGGDEPNDSVGSGNLFNPS